MNLVENGLPLFFTSLLAMIASASPGWINGLVIAAVALRFIYTALYVSGIGPKKGPGPRTGVFAIGLILNLIIGAIAGFALF